MLKINNNILSFNDKIYRCAIGKNGFATDKKEGDGCSPIGAFTLRECWVRADRLPTPQTQLPLRIINENDGWCDDVTHPEYNKHVTLPFAASHENLWRNEHVYDLIIPLGYNDDPIIKGKGSAIFMHLAKQDYSGTEGCIALAKEDLLEILKHCSTETVITIEAS